MLRRETVFALSLASATFAVACRELTPPDQPSLASAAADSVSCLLPAIGAVPPGGGHPALTARDSVPLSGAPTAVAVSPAGVVYVTRATQGSAVRADLPSTTLSAPFPVGAVPSQVRISPDGQTAFISNQNARTITYVAVATNQIIGSTAVPAGSILTIGLSPDGARLYALTDFHGVYIIETTTRQIVDKIPASKTGSLLTGIAFHPFSPCVYIAARDQGTVRTIDLRTNAVVRTAPVTGGRIQNVAVSRDGATLLATDIQRSLLIVWDLATGSSSFQTYPVGTPMNRNAFDVAVTPDNTQVYISTLADGKVFVLDLATRALVAAVSTGGNGRYIGFNASGTHAVIANEAGWVDFLHGVTSVCTAPPSGTPRAGLGHPSLDQRAQVALSGTPFAVAVSAGGTAYVTQTHAGFAARADLPVPSFVDSFPVGGLPSQVRISPDGRTAYFSNQDARTITYVDVASNQATGTTPVPSGSILTIGLSPDGARLYALTDFSGIYVIDTGTRAIVATIPAASTGSLLTGVAFHPFASCMYVAARDQGMISVVDLQTNAVVVSRSVAGGRIQNVTLSRDGATLFATDIQRSKLIRWDLSSTESPFQETGIGTLMDRNAFDVAVTPDNTQVYVSTLADGKVFILNLASLTPVAEVATGGSPRYIAFDTTGSAAIVPNEAGYVDFIGLTAPPPPPPPPPSVCLAPPVGTAPTGRGHPSLVSQAVVPVTGAPFGVAVSPAGVVYVTQAHAGSAVRADLPSTVFSASFPVGDLPSQVRISPDGQTAYVSNQNLSAVTFIHVATNEAFATVSVPGGSVLTLGLSPDGRRIYALTDYYGVHVIDTDSRTVIGTIPASQTGTILTGIAFHPFAPCMYVAARDEGRIVTVDLQRDSVVRSQTVAGSRIQNVAVSHDGAQLFATDIQRSKLLVQDLSADSTGGGFVERAVGIPQDRNAFDVAITPDNAQVYVSTIADGTVYIFDRVTLDLLGAVTTQVGTRYIAFDSGGTTAVITSEFGWVNFVR